MCILELRITSPFHWKTLVNSFLKSQFSCCSLISIFSFKRFNKKIGRIHEMSLRLILSDHESMLDETLVTLNDRLFTEI